MFDIEYIFAPSCCMTVVILLLKILSFIFFFSCTGPDCAFLGFAVKQKTSLFSVFCLSQRICLLLGLLNYSQSKQCCHLYFRPDCHAWRMILPLPVNRLPALVALVSWLPIFENVYTLKPLDESFVFQLSQHFQAWSLCVLVLLWKSILLFWETFLQASQQHISRCVTDLLKLCRWIVSLLLVYWIPFFS